jgi:hypothetical protein
MGSLSAGSLTDFAMRFIFSSDEAIVNGFVAWRTGEGLRVQHDTLNQESRIRAARLFGPRSVKGAWWLAPSF